MSLEALPHNSSDSAVVSTSGKHWTRLESLDGVQCCRSGLLGSSMYHHIEDHLLKTSVRT